MTSGAGRRPAKKTAAKKAAPRRTATKTAAAAKKTAAKKAAPRSRARKLGPTEQAMLRQLREANADRSAFAMSALALARSVDEATSGGERASAAREMRMTLGTALQLQKPISPAGAPADESGVVVGADRLEQARRRSSGGTT